MSKKNPALPEEAHQYFSKRSLEVFERFGAEAPHVLNEYSCAVEDALIAQGQKLAALKKDHKNLQKEQARLLKLLNKAVAENS